MDTKSRSDTVQTTDAELVERIRSGQEEALSVLLSRYTPMVRYWASRFSDQVHQQDDLMQEGLIALYSAVKVYKPSCASFATFASVCVKRSMVSVYRQAGSKKAVPSAALSAIEEHEASDKADPESFVIGKENFDEFLSRIRQALSPFEYAVLSHYLGCGNYDDVCVKLGIARKEMNNALQRARKKIRAISSESC